MNDIEFRADAAEFVVFDPRFRAAFNPDNGMATARALEIRGQVLEILLRTGNDLDGRIDELRAIPTTSPVKSIALDFLMQRQKPLGASSNGCHRLEFTPDEQEQKKRAKELYWHCRYAEALSIGLEMIRANSNLINDYSMTGFIMYCYYKLGDFENALKYARLAFKLSPSTDAHLRSKVHVTMECAYKLGLYKEVMETVRKYPEFRNEWNISRLAAKAAYKTGSYKEALEAAQFYISANKIKHFEDLYVLEIAIYSAVKVGQYETAFRTCKMYLKQKRSLFVLQMATNLAARFGDSESTRAYKAGAEELERRVDIRGCPEIEQISNCEE